jgi:hypothetical protein
MRLFFPWATKEHLMKKMSLKQILFYYNCAWEVKKKEAEIHWGTYGSLLNEANQEGQTKANKNSKSGGLPTLEEIEPYYRGPSYEFRDGVVWNGDQKVAYYQK